MEESTQYLSTNGKTKKLNHVFIVKKDTNMVKKMGIDFRIAQNTVGMEIK